MDATRYFDVICPTTDETVRVGLEAGAPFAPGDIARTEPDTQLWWTVVVRQYDLDRRANPSADPTELFEAVLRGRTQPVPQA
jgi:hypothetical protein